jgi:N-acyl-D-amino-acid deacylase
MTRIAKLASGLIALFSALLLPGQLLHAVQATEVDLVIAGAEVLDGLGNPPPATDVVIGGGRILFIGDVDADTVDPDKIIDAQGRTLAPGFIDPHSHGDPFETPAFENFLAMGVTTVTLGQDGSSPAVDDLADWLSAVTDQGIGPNLAMLVGHGTLRSQAGIGTQPEPTPAQMEDLLERLDRALAVTFGLSTGLEYNPGLNAGFVELDSIARVVGSRDRIIMSHLRSEDDDRLEAALAELLAQGQHARVHVSHLKSVYGHGAARAEEILALLENARDDGIQVTADLYPYTASYTGIELLFPEWAKTREGFEEGRDERYDELAAYLRERVLGRNGPEATLLGTEPYTGMTLAELAAELDKPFERVLIDDIGPDGASAAYFIMDDELQSRLLLDPHVAVCSDGNPSGFHPRGHGTFARIIEEYVVRREQLDLPEAVRKMTSLPAQILGLADRGTLQVGKAADLVIFDPDRVRATATYTEPFALAEGFDVVIVNGRVARRDGVLTGTMAGRVLRP